MVSDAVVVDVALLVGALLVGLCLQWLIVRVVDQPALLAEPNHRSSHDEPTPTMGGTMIVVVILGFILFFAVESFGVLAAALGTIAVVGLWDDISELPGWLRLIVHLGASVVAVYALDLDLPIVLMPITVVLLAWFVNLYNFMDGIDGIAAAQCLVFCAGAQFVSGGVPGEMGQLLWVLSGCTLAFLAFNWPPARVFMGDVGSGFLGLLIGTVAIFLANLDLLPLVSSLILLAVFWFDATYTLCVRMLTRQEFTQAHRSHVYQRLAAARGHLWTTVVYVLFAVFWLVPLAWISRHFPSLELLALVLAIGPIAILCWRFRAGMLSAHRGARASG